MVQTSKRCRIWGYTSKRMQLRALSIYLPLLPLAHTGGLDRPQPGAVTPWRVHLTNALDLRERFFPKYTLHSRSLFYELYKDKFYLRNFVCSGFPQDVIIFHLLR